MNAACLHKVSLYDLFHQVSRLSDAFPAFPSLTLTPLSLSLENQLCEVSNIFAPMMPWRQRKFRHFGAKIPP